MYNIGMYDKANLLSWVFISILCRRLANIKHFNESVGLRNRLKIFKYLSKMMIGLTVGGFVNEVFKVSDNPKFYWSNVSWAILVIVYYIAVITIFLVKIKRVGRH